MLTAEDSRSTGSHTDRECWMPISDILVITVLSAHLRNLAQWRDHPFIAEAKSGGGEIWRCLSEMGLSESPSVLLQLHFSASHVSLFSMRY